MRRIAGVAIALVALASGCGGGHRTPHFQGASGWHLLGAHGELVAANVPFAPADRSLASPPARTVGSLPRNGVVLWLLVSRRHASYDAKFPATPLRVGNGLPSNPPEGFRCAPAVLAHCFSASDAIRRMQARVAGWDVALTIFFGTDHPSAAQVEEANAELARFSP